MFTLENNIVRPNTETLLVKEFLDIWEYDKSTKKEKALYNLAYIFFLVNPTKVNPFYGYAEKDRSAKIIQHLKIKDTDLFPNTLINKAVKFYSNYWETLSPAKAYYESSLKAADQLRKFFDTLDISKVNAKTGNPLYKPAEITKALKETEDVLKTLLSLKSKVEEQSFENVKTKANRDINPFEE
jgi:hypothetical protein